MKLFLIGWWFAIDCENSHFGGLFGEVSGGEFTEFVGNFVLLLLFAVFLPSGDSNMFFSGCRLAGGRRGGAWRVWVICVRNMLSE